MVSLAALAPTLFLTEPSSESSRTGVLQAACGLYR